MIRKITLASAVLMLFPSAEARFSASLARPAPQSSATAAQSPAPPHVLAIYTDKGEQDHIDFANDAIKFFSDFSKQKGFAFESTDKLGFGHTGKAERYPVGPLAQRLSSHCGAAGRVRRLHENEGSLAWISCGGVQRREHEVAVVCGFSRRRGVLREQLAAVAGEVASR